ncbi:intermediate cleaving peptidase 55, mitochondrial isoform X4 [Cynara cardunculus var. scolymus]|uniref:intermediate cleaving peptidase 55, mitochondrial isoform X4 n=1 Tax=Cynara cardunculus var. scolymus TaxID=59895 RepID=UPI000D626644|nr:intermediate cleaving peptidase 55, mitochondrial isoform X4 [Cynara cardunculus var. scolymus]
MQYLHRKLTSNRSSFKTVHQVLLRQFYSTDKCYDAGQPTPSTHPQLLKEGEITPGITCDEYISRRKRLLELLPEQSVAIVAAAPVKMMTDVVPYNFRQDADYLYITGCQQPGGIAVLGHDFGLCMFMPEATPQDITWQGQIAGIDAATEFFKADQSYPISKLHKALLQTMLHSKISPYENILSAKVEYECRMRGAQRMAFNPVVGGGLNGSVIHYSRNDQKVKDGDLVLMDVGCELHGYVSDLTRTWPPCGSFSDVHKELYDLVVETNKECIELCKPGASIQHVHNYSVNKLFRGLKEIGILKDNRLHSYHQLNPTSIGHYLGMDVHDCSKIGYDRTLKPGVVITIEPGVYIPTNFNCAERYQGIGIRIEDEVLITESGYEVLTGSLPKEINHIETLLNNHSYGGTFASSL